MVTPSKIRVGDTGEDLDTTVVTTSAGQVHREAVFQADPTNPEARANVRNADPAPNDYGSVVRPVITQEFWSQVAKGNVPGHSIIHKFGTNPSVGTSFVPLSQHGHYRTPQVSGATALRVQAGDANDTALGSGARQISVQGLDETGNEITVTLPTAGTSAGAASSETFLRVYRAFVSESGTYATETGGSHAADINIENATGGTHWADISVTDFPRSQSQIGAYSVKLGYTAYMNGLDITVDSGKTVDVIFFKREGILKTEAPYDAMRTQLEFNGIATEIGIGPKTPLGPYPALTDIGFMAKVGAGSASVSVDFEIMLIEDGF